MNNCIDFKKGDCKFKINEATSLDYDKCFMKGRDIQNNKYGETNTKFDSNGIPLECVIAYKSDNQTNSYEISVYLESRFFKEKMKWDGGNDSSRFEVGNDLRLNTELVVTDAGINV